MEMAEFRKMIRFSEIVEVLAKIERKDKVVLAVLKKYRECFRDLSWVQSLRFDFIGCPGIRKNSPEYTKLVKAQKAVKKIADETRKLRNCRPEFLKLLASLFALEKRADEQISEHISQNPEMSDNVIEIIREGTGKRNYDGSRFINQSNRPFHHQTNKNNGRR